MIKFPSLSRGALCGLIFAALTFAPWPSLAASITSVEVLPPLPTSIDSITLRVDLLYPSSGYGAGSVDIACLDSTDVHLDIFVSSPAPGEIVLPALVSQVVDAMLGLLPEAEYSYTVRLFEVPRDTFIPLFQEAESGGFTVVPEPTTLHLVGAALLAFLGIRRTHSVPSTTPSQSSSRRAPSRSMP